MSDSDNEFDFEPTAEAMSEPSLGEPEKVLQTSRFFRVYPPVVDFHGIEPGILYVLTLSIQNSSQIAQRMQIVRPKTANFVLNHIPSASLAPGLDIKAEVEFQMIDAGDNRDYHDSIKICVGGETVEVPLNAYKPAPNMTFDSYINFGRLVKDGDSMTKIITLTNEGTAEAEYTIDYDEETCPFTISPKSYIIPPGARYSDDIDDDFQQQEGANTTQLSVTFKPEVLGHFRKVVQVQIPGQPKRLLDILCEVVEQRLEFRMPAGERDITQVPFGGVHYGHERTITAILTNNGPVQASFNITTDEEGDAKGSDEEDDEEGSEAASQKGPNQDEDDNIPKALLVRPLEGVIPPYGSLPVEFKFKPILGDTIRGYTHLPDHSKDEIKYTLGVTLESQETKQEPMHIDVHGTAHKPLIDVSQKVFKFGECPAFDRRDILLTLKNVGQLTIPYSLNKVANFVCKPSKGILGPGQSQNIVVGFVPAQLGIFKNVLHLVVCEGLQVVPLQVSGTANTSNRVPVAKRGQTAQADDFKPTFKFVTNAQAEKQPASKFVRPEMWDAPDVAPADGEEYRCGAETTISYSLSEMKARTEHRSKYNNFLKEKRRVREQKESKLDELAMCAKAARPAGPEKDLDPINLGMEVATGAMPSPRLEVPTEVDGLYLERPLDGMASFKGKRNRGPPLNEDVLIKKKYKPQPTSQAEIVDCSMYLEPDDLHCVSAGPKVLNFGKVNVNSINKKSFFVTNDLPQQVLAELKFVEIEELSQSTPESQVLPCGVTGGFDIWFTPTEAQDFQATVTYVINGQHTFKFTVLAQVLPITVDLSRKKIHFEFEESNFDFSVSEKLTVTNPGNAVAKFQWMLAGGSFSVNPEQGSIQPGASVESTVTYTPSFGSKPDEMLALEIEAGVDEELHCVGVMEDAKCVFVEKKLDFGEIAVGIEHEKTVMIRSSGSSAAIFAVEPPDPRLGISLSPLKGRVLPGQKQAITVKLLGPKPRNYEGVTLMMNIRGGRPAKLPLMGRAVIPDVEVAQEEFNYEGVTIGATARQLLSIENTGRIPAVLYMELDECPEFSVELPEELLEADIEDRLMVPVDGASKKEESAVNRRYSMTHGEVDEGEQPDEEVVEPILKWKVMVQPMSTLSFYLLFAPVEVAEFNFPLPLALAGVRNCPGLKRAVIAEGLKPRVLLSKTVADFKERVVTLDRVKKVPFSMEVHFTNDDPDTIKWDIDTDALADDDQGKVFNCSPQSGELAPGERSTVRFTFLPEDARAYDAAVPVYLDGMTERPYLMVTMKGVGILPHLTFDRPRVIMPIVPLGVTSKMRFHIVNTGYDNLDLRYRMPIDPQRVPVVMSFPEGQTLGIAKQTLPVDLTFISKSKPLSFNSEIEFYDAADQKFIIEIVGVADNCILTNYGFLHQHENEFNYYAKAEPTNRPVNLLPLAQIRDIEKKLEAQNSAGSALKRRRKGPDGAAPEEPAKKKSIDISPGAAAVSLYEGFPLSEEDDVQYILRYLNNTLLSTPVEVLPGDVTALDGKPIIQMIESASGKKIPGNRKFTNDQRHRWGEVLDFYRGLVTHLKSFGALLYNVEPESLLSKEDFVRCQEAANHSPSERLTPQQILSRKASYERQWEITAREAWVIIILQTLRVFVLNRVTIKKFRELPGAPPPTPREPEPEPAQKGPGQGKKEKVQPPDAEFTCSNVYSVAESCMLKWMTYNLNANSSSVDPLRVKNFDTDLQDGTVLCALICGHCPNLESPGQPLADYHRLVDDIQHQEENAAKVVAAMKALLLPFEISVSEIVHMNARNGLLLTMYLYNTLPSFMPKTTIVFTGTLGVPIQKCIELRNPSRRKIAYTVILEGSEDFMMEVDRIEIEPRSSASFPIQLNARFSHMVEGRLTFRSKREAGVSAATMVFQLRSDIRSRQAQRTISMATDTYDQVETEVEIENPYQKDCVFKLTVQQEQLPSGPMGARSGPIGITPPEDAATPPPPPPAHKGHKKGKHGHADKEDKPKSKDAHLEPFFTKSTTVKVKAGQTASISMSLLPFKEGNYRAQLIFFDENAGEFLYEVLGEAKLPQPSEDIKFTAEAGAQGRIDKDILLPIRNTSYWRARATAVERLSGGAKKKAQEALNKQNNAPQPEARFRVEFNSPYFQTQGREVVVAEPVVQATGRSKKAQEAASASKETKLMCQTPRGNSGGVNSIALTFMPREAGAYPCKLILRPVDPSSTDTRVYSLLADVLPQSKKTSIEFSVPARQSVVQDIPLSNGSGADWTLSAAIRGEGAALFKGPPRLVVPANGRASYTLSFSPTWICDTKAMLVLTNPATGDKFEYSLTGVGEEPLAENHIVIACQARDKIVREFDVQNDTDDDIEYNVESDLASVSGASTMYVDSEAVGKYALSICPQLGGSYTGSVTFTTPDGEYIWYTVEIQATSPEPEKELRVSSAVRQAVAVEISLANPVDEQVEFDVALEGAGLLGDDTFTLQPGQDGTYELLYSPLLVGTQTGSVSFTNQKLGEFWYKLHLTADPADPTELEAMSAPAGKTARQPILLENPLGEEMTLHSKIDNRRNFAVVPNTVTIPPYGSAEAVLEYTPSSLTETESTTVTFTNPKLGEWVYLCSGTGELPGDMDEVEVTAPRGATSSSSFVFRNPFGTILPINIRLVAKTPGIARLFKLLLKKPQLNVQPYSQMQIPISFSPEVIAQVQAMVSIQANVPGVGPVEWRYPIRGVAESSSNDVFHFSCKAKETIEQPLEIVLSGLADIDPVEGETFTFELRMPERRTRSFVERSLTVEPVQLQLFDPTQPIIFDVAFEPLRTFAAPVQLLVYKSSGGRWRFDLELEATDPDPDDVIQIQSSLNTTSSVSFKLTNQFTIPTPFLAEFSSDSSLAFTISPSEGELPPYGREGQDFIVAFKPTEYGKMQVARLCIVTEEMQYTYEIRGSHLDYQVPEQRARIDNALDPEMAARLGKHRGRNILRANMKPDALKAGYVKKQGGF
jgi:hypothetical protein